MQIEDFDYPLDESLIAQAPAERRTDSRLLHFNREQASKSHRHFADLPTLLRKGDVLVLNESRVFPARIVGQKAETGGAVELLLVHPLNDDSTEVALLATQSAWLCLGQASKPIREGAELVFDGLTGRVNKSLGDGSFEVFLISKKPLKETLQRAAQIPLPPYIKRAPDAADEERYQTVFASSTGSVAAPTAGLHFTTKMLDEVSRGGVEVCKLVLDVGPGTFLPIRQGNIDTHKMHTERYVISDAVASRVNTAKGQGRRVVAVGTTVVRALESSAIRQLGQVSAGADQTALFIKPGFRFQVVDAMLTNFHLPKSTLLMLVSAFAGLQPTLDAYRLAVKERYRFFSYGDAMFIE